MRRKQLAAEVLYRSGFLHLLGWWRKLRRLGGPVFLMGHRVLPESAAEGDPIDRMALLSGHAITPDELRRRLGFVRRFVMPAGEPAVLAHGLPDHRRFYVTFDDGYLDNLTHARPVLDALGIKAVIFFVGKLVQQPCAVPWWDGLAGESLVSAPDLDEAMLRYGALCAADKQQFVGLSDQDMSRTGARRYASEAELLSLPDTFHAANHTASHADLSGLGPAAIELEIEAGDSVVRKSPRYLPVLAFPFGYFNSAVKEWLARTRRYEIAFATGNGIDGDPLCQRRINLNVQPFSLFAAHCVGLMH